MNMLSHAARHHPPTKFEWTDHTTVHTSEQSTVQSTEQSIIQSTGHTAEQSTVHNGEHNTIHKHYICGVICVRDSVVRYIHVQQMNIASIPMRIYLRLRCIKLSFVPGTLRIRQTCIFKLYIFIHLSGQFTWSQCIGSSPIQCIFSLRWYTDRLRDK